MTLRTVVIDRDPENRSQALMFLDRYSKSNPPPVSSKGIAFAQKGANGGGKKGKKDDKQGDLAKDDKPMDPYKDMECFNCGEKGHPARFCPKKKSDDDSSSISSKSSKSGKKSLEKQFKSIKKSFAQLQTAIKESESDSSSDEQSHFQFLGVNEDLDVMLSQKRSLQDVDLREVILLDNQSTVSLFCNPKLVQGIKKTDKTLRLQSNGGQMVIKKVAEIGEGNTKVWFSFSGYHEYSFIEDG